MIRALALLAVLGASACAGGSTSVAFDTLHYPASLSPVLRPGRRDRPPVVVGQLAEGQWAWSLLWGNLDLHDLDFSEEINAAVRAARGTGVVNLTIVTRGCAINFLVPLEWIPIWPSCTVVEVHGDIVRES